jgi:hypothetical protein
VLEPELEAVNQERHEVHRGRRARQPLRQRVGPTVSRGRDYLRRPRRNLILRAVVSSRSPRVTHSFRYAYGRPVQIFVWRGPIQIAEIVENRAACGGCGSLAARAVDTYRQKSLNYRKKAPPAADLKPLGSAGPPRVTHIFTDRKIKLRRPYVARSATACCWLGPNRVPRVDSRDYYSRLDYTER